MADTSKVIIGLFELPKGFIMLNTIINHLLLCESTRIPRIKKERFHKFKLYVLQDEHKTGNLADFNYLVEDNQKQDVMRNYLKHILTMGAQEEKQEIMGFIKTKFILRDKSISPAN